MTDLPMEDMDRTQQERESEAPEGPDEDLLEQQEHKGYGEDEGEREESLPE